MIAIMEVVLGLLSGISDPIAKRLANGCSPSLPRFLAKPCTEIAMEQACSMGDFLCKKEAFSRLMRFFPGSRSRALSAPRGIVRQWGSAAIL